MLPEFVTLQVADDYCEVHKRSFPASNWEMLNRAIRQFGAINIDRCVCNIHDHQLYCADEEQRYADLSSRRDEEVRLAAKKKSPAKSEGDKSGRWYAITFTRPESDKSPEGLIKSVTRLLRSKQVSAEQWCYSLELTVKQTPHAHVYLFSNKYFDYKKAGAFNDGHRYDIQVAKFGESYANYLNKPESKPTGSWLALHGLEGWFFCSENYSGPRPTLGPAGLEARQPE